MTPSESETLKTQMAVMGEQMNNMSIAHNKNAEATTELTQAISEMVLNLKEREVEDKYLRQRVDKLEEGSQKFIADCLPVIKRVRKSQENKDKFTSSMTTNWGKLLSIAIIVAAASALGLDLGSILSIK